MMKEAVKWDFARLVREIPPSRAAIAKAEKQGKPAPKPVPYLPYPAVIAAAGAAPRLASKLPFEVIFGGAVLRMEYEGQECWYPLLDTANRPIPAPAATARDVADNIHRAGVKTLALRGWGLALYAGHKEPARFLKALGITPESDPAKVNPLVADKEGRPYIQWAVAVAAAGITDPDFRWRVLRFPAVDPHSGEIREEPYIMCPNGYMVAVEVTWRGKVHVEYRAIMGLAEVQTKAGTKLMDFQTLPDPDAGDWNKAVMRCLAKAVAVCTGYGLSVYAREDMDDLEARFVGGGKPTAAATPATQAAPEPAAAPAAPPAGDAVRVKAIIADLREMLAASGKDEAALMSWLKRPGESLDTLDEATALRAMSALRPRKAA